LTTSVNISNIRFYGYGDNSLTQNTTTVTADAGLSTGILTNNQNSVTLHSILTQAYSPDVTQNDDCTAVTTYYGLRILVGCSSVSTITVQQNNFY